MQTITTALLHAKQQGLNNLDSKVLLKHATEFNNLAILTQPNSMLSEKQFANFKNYVERRKNDEPVAYITGIKEFYSLDFLVNKHTLIPRPDTELLVEKTIKYIEQNNISTPKILDLGTGSGAIVISILKNVKNATATAVDLNPETIKVAKQNAKNHGVDKQIQFLESNWFENIDSFEKFDIIVSNPPYITSQAMQNLANDVKNHEPQLALEGGQLGYEAYIDIINTAPKYLKHQGGIFLEIGFDQAEKIMLLLKKDIWTGQTCYKDLAKNDRLIFANLK